MKSIDKKEVNFFSKNKMKSILSAWAINFKEDLIEKFSTHVGIPFQTCKTENTYSLPTKSKVNRNCCFLVQRPGSCTMPFISSTGRRAGALRQHESKAKAAAWLLGHHANKISQQGRRHCHRRISYSEKAEMLLVQFGQRQTFLEIAPRLNWCKTSESYLSISLPSHNHTN